MNTLNQEFIEKVKEHESDFLEDRIPAQTKDDWENFKVNIYHLGSLYEQEENESVEVRNSKDYLRIIWQSIHKIEEKYNYEISNETLEFVIEQLKALCRFYQPIFYRRELEASAKLENDQNVPSIDVTDILNDHYHIKESDYKNFENSCEKQMKLNEEYKYAYTCIYGNKKDKIKLIEEYIKDAEGLKQEFLEEKIQISKKEKWMILKDRINAFKKNCDALHRNLEVTEKFKLNKNGAEKFIDLLASYIEKMEEKFESIEEKDLVGIMENLYIICKYNSLTEEKDKIIFSAKQIPKNGEEKTAVLTSTKAVVSIPASQAEVWKTLDIEQKQMQEKYEEAIAFAFGEPMEEETKRGM